MGAKTVAANHEEEITKIPPKSNEEDNLGTIVFYHVGLYVQTKCGYYAKRSKINI